MVERSMSDSTWEEVDKFMRDESFCRMSDTNPKASLPQVNVDESSVAASPDQLNGGFIDVTVVQEGQTTTESYEKHNQTIQTPATVDEHNSGNDIVERHKNDTDHQTSTQSGYVSTGTMPETPNIKSIGTMKSTPLMVSTGTMTKTTGMRSKSTMTTIPETTTTGTMAERQPTTSTKTMTTIPKTTTTATTTKLQKASSTATQPDITTNRSIGTMTTRAKYTSFSQ